MADGPHPNGEEIGECLDLSRPGRPTANQDLDSSNSPLSSCFHRIEVLRLLLVKRRNACWEDVKESSGK
jgi:hypothetical protein